MKNTQKKIVSVSLLTLLAFTFNACGGGGSGGSSGSQNAIAIDVNCTSSAAISSYIPLERGDTISIASGNPIIVTYHDSNGTKRVCLDASSSGSANILR